MTKQLLFALCAFFFTQTSYAQDLVWANGFAWFSPSLATTVDAEGNLYLAGIDLGNHDIDPGPAVWAIPGPANKAVGFVAKFDPTGQPLWLRSVGAPDAGMLFTGPAATGNPGNHNIKIILQPITIPRPLGMAASLQRRHALRRGCPLVPLNH